MFGGCLRSFSHSSLSQPGLAFRTHKYMEPLCAFLFVCLLAAAEMNTPTTTTSATCPTDRIAVLA